MGFNIQYIYEAVDRFTPTAARIADVTDTLRLKMMYAGDAAEIAGKKVRQMGKSIELYASLPAQLFTDQALHKVYEFETSMNDVMAVTKATGAQYDQLRQKAIEMGLQAHFSASQAAEAMYRLAKSGMDVNNILGSIQPTLNLAAAGKLSMEDAARITTSVMNEYGSTLKDLPHMMDVLAVATNKSQASVQDLGVAMRYVAPYAKALNIPFESTVATLTVLAKAGNVGTKGGTAMREMLSGLLKPRKGLSEVLQGITLQKDGLIAVIEQLKKVHLSAAGAIKLFGDRGGAGVLSLMRNSDELNALALSLHNVDGAAQAISNIQLDGFVGAVRRMGAAWNTLAISLVDKDMQQQISSLIMLNTRLMNSISSAAPWVRHLAVYIIGFTAILGPAVISLGFFMQGLKYLEPAVMFLLSPIRLLTRLLLFLVPVVWAFLGPIDLIVLAITALAVGVVWCYNKFKGFRDVISEVVEELKKAYNFIKLLSPEAIGYKLGGMIVDHYMHKDAAVGTSLAPQRVQADINVHMKDPGKTVDYVQYSHSGWGSGMNLGVNMGGAR